MPAYSTATHAFMASRGPVLMVEHITSMVDVEEMLWCLYYSCPLAVHEVWKYVVQELGMCLHVGIEYDNNVIVRRRPFGENVELERMIDVPCFAMDGDAGPLPGRRQERAAP